MLGRLRRRVRGRVWLHRWVRGKLPPVDWSGLHVSIAELAAWHTAAARWEVLHGPAATRRPVQPSPGVADRVRRFYDDADTSVSALLPASWRATRTEGCTA